MNKTETLIYVTGKCYRHLLKNAIDRIIPAFPQVQNWIIEERDYDLVVFVWYNVCPTLPIEQVEQIKEKFNFFITGFIQGCEYNEIHGINA